MPKWRMENGRWVKSEEVATEPKVNGFTPKVNGVPEKSKVNEITEPKVVEVPEPKLNGVKTIEPEPEVTVDENNNKPEEIKFDNLTIDDLIRGSTPEDIENRCIEIVKAYLGGSWANIKSNADVTVTRIAGGLTNQLYRVHLNDSVARVENEIYSDEPSDVAIKLYQSKHMKNYSKDGSENNERLNDNIILTIISEVEIGPKVYGIFNDGVVLGYHEHEQFRAKHQENPVLLTELANLLAQIHHLSVPVTKTANLMLKDLQENIDYAYDKLAVQDVIDELKLENFTKQNLRDAYQELLGYIEQVNCPIVFCHHDFRGGNIMVTLPEEKLKIIDLEYCGYGPRGYDAGTFFTDWQKKDIFDQVTYILPPDADVANFAQKYIDACDKLVPGYSSQPENSLEQVVKEIKLFYMVQHMFFMSIMIKMEDALIPNLPFDPKAKMTRIEMVYDRYNKIKEALLEDGTIQPL